MHFLGPVDFCGVRFAGDASFRRAIFGDTASFRVIESGRCTFTGARFNGEVYTDFWNATTLTFEETTFNAWLVSTAVVFGGDVSLLGIPASRYFFPAASACAFDV